MRRWFCCSQFRASYREHEHEFPSSLDEKEGNGFDTKSDPTKAPPPIEIPELSLDELKEKTDNFGSKALIGEGSYGRVYYAILDSRKHRAVKKLDTSADPEPDNEFLCNIDETYLNFCVKWVDGVLVFNFCFDFVKLAIYG